MENYKYLKNWGHLADEEKIKAIRPHIQPIDIEKLLKDPALTLTGSWVYSNAIPNDYDFIVLKSDFDHLAESNLLLITKFSDYIDDIEVYVGLTTDGALLNFLVCKNPSLHKVWVETTQAMVMLYEYSSNLTKLKADRVRLFRSIKSALMTKYNVLENSFSETYKVDRISCLYCANGLHITKSADFDKWTDDGLCAKCREIGVEGRHKEHVKHAIFGIADVWQGICLKYLP